MLLGCRHRKYPLNDFPKKLYFWDNKIITTLKNKNNGIENRRDI